MNTNQLRRRDGIIRECNSEQIKSRVDAQRKIENRRIEQEADLSLDAEVDRLLREMGV